jgi:hypothetical protein
LRFLLVAVLEVNAGGIRLLPSRIALVPSIDDSAGSAREMPDGVWQFREFDALEDLPDAVIMQFTDRLADLLAASITPEMSPKMEA